MPNTNNIIDPEHSFNAVGGKSTTTKRLATAKNNIFNISSSSSFLRTLAEELVDGKIITGYDPVNNPLILSDTTIYLPTRRAARVLSMELLQAMNRKSDIDSIILPHIRSIGDLDEEEITLSLDNDLPLDLGKPINPVERQMILARLTRAWSVAITEESRRLYDSDNVAMLATSSGAIALANDLISFMDQIETEESSWSQIKNVKPDDHAEWWQLTVKFLEIVMEAWPRTLESKGEIGPAELRKRVIDFRCDQLLKNSSTGPVIIAGTTGSIPATSRLLKTIAGLERGAVILPGVDLDLPDSISSDQCKEQELLSENVSSTHPQFGLSRLLGQLETSRSELIVLGNPDKNLKTRERIINTILLPANDSMQWHKIRKGYPDQDIQDAFEDVLLIEASDQRQEALAIALALRHALETDCKNAALVTPDRDLARRVSSELERFNIQIDDSAGSALSQAPCANYFRLLVQTVFSSNPAVAFSALLKNNFIQMSRDKKLARRQAELLEILLIRDALTFPDITQLENLVAQKRENIKGQKYAPKIISSLLDEEWNELQSYAREISSHLCPLLSLASITEEQPLHHIFQILMQCALSLNTDQQGNNFLFEGRGGKELYAHLISYCDYQGTEFPIFAWDTPSVFDVLLAGKRVREGGRSHPRLQIYGQLEARLQHADLLILGGLNETSWPQTASNDPFLNRPMKSDLSLPLPERRIGLSAHDFVQFSGAKEVIYTRSIRMDDAPSVASRWLQRLKTFLGEDISKKLFNRGKTYIDLARAIDSQFDFQSGKTQITNPPAPAPPLKYRPDSLSFTEIETWIRDPYAIYAKHILKVQSLPPLVREADPALRGTLYHNILADFVTSWQGEITGNVKSALSQIADKHFGEAKIPAEIAVSWRPRFDAVAEAFLLWEAKRRGDVSQSHCEVYANTEIESTGFYLRGRADRIDVLKDGSLSVIDYKTGSNPTSKQARSLSPQLSLEAALTKRGKFNDVSSAPISEMAYVRLKEGEGWKIDDITKGQKKEEFRSADELCEKAYAELVAQIKAYQQSDQAYVSRYAAMEEKNITGDYDHLARVREWSIGEDENSSSGGDE